MEKETNKKVIFSESQMKIAEEYCGNCMSKLKAVCYKEFSKLGGIKKMEYDELYSLGLYVLYQSIKKYDADKNCSFHTYLIGNLNRRYDTYLRNKNRKKRCNIQEDEDGNKIFVKDESFNDIRKNGKALEECLDSGSRIDDNLEDCFNSLYMSENVKKYLDRLSRKQREIVILLSNGYDNQSILEKLHMTKKDFKEHMARIKSGANVRFLYYKKGR